MKHIVYLTENTINKKLYVGVHNGSNDSYLGSGVLLNKDIQKFGSENFKRTTLFECDTREEALWLESILVPTWLVLKWGYGKKYYNSIEGGNESFLSKYITQEEYEERLKENNPTLECIGKYTGALDKIKVKCKICNHKWKSVAWDFLRGYGCPKCSIEKRSFKIVGKSPDGKIYDFNSSMDVERQFNIPNGSVVACCKGKYKHTQQWQFMFLSDYEKGKQFSNKKFKLHKSSKPVKTDRGHVFSSTYKAEMQAELFGFKNINRSCIRRVVDGNRNYAGSYKDGTPIKWFIATKEEVNKKAIKTKDYLGKPIIVTTEKGEELYFASSKEAIETLKLKSKGGVSNCLKRGTSYKGYKFKFT